MALVDRHPKPVTEAGLRRLLEQVRAGQLPRRRFVAQLLACGIPAPMAGLLLLDAGVAQAQPSFVYTPKKRGGGGNLRLLQVDAAMLLNPHFAGGLKDQTAARIFYEPLAQWDNDANLQPVLAAAIPSRDNGGVAADGLSVVWKLKKGVRWHDGQPFTADDVVFNWQYATDPATAAVTAGFYSQLRIEKIDAHTVRVVFDRPTPFWPGQYCLVMQLPKHLFAAYSGATSRDAPNNNKPVGTAAYTFVDFRPGDLLRAALNPNYHVENCPHFDALEMKGGGDATSAARAVLQTAEYDYAAVAVEDDVLKKMEAGGKGRVAFTTGSATTSIYLNFTDPAPAADGERSGPKTRHPLFADPAVRRALGLLVDRQNMQAFVFGRQGVATSNFINQPARYRSANTAAEFNIDKARALLDAAGWKPGADGVRSKDGKRLSLVFQGPTIGQFQKLQALVKQAAQKAGIAIEIKAIATSVFFSSDSGNPDTYNKFHADLEAFNWTSYNPDPQTLMLCFVSWEAAGKDNKWSGRNTMRWQNSTFDALYRAAEVELDAIKRASLFIRMNDLVVADGYLLPVVARTGARALASGLRLPLSAWSADVSSLPYWYRDT